MRKLFVIFLLTGNVCFGQSAMACLIQSETGSGTTPPYEVDDVLMKNFRIQDSDKDRIYFDSTDIITATNDTGFVLWEDVDITGIVINTGSTTNHYLTLDGDLNIFSNPIIEYDNGNVQSGGVDLNKMRLQRVSNNLSEPTPTTEYYIDSSVSSSGNGLSEGTAFKTLAEGFAVLSSGVKLWVKQGVYSEGGLSTNLDGTANNPWQIEGYKNNPGDGAELTRSVGMSFDSSELPWLQTTSANGFLMDYAAYFIIKNFQFTEHSDEAIAITHGHHGLIKNVYGDADGGGKTAISWMNDDTGATAKGHVRLERCYGANGTQRVMRFQGRNNRAIDSWAVTSKITNQDYYFSFYGTRSVANGGSGESTGCSVLDCYINRFPTDTHSGHGVSMKAGGTPITDIQVVSNGLVENIDIINVAQAIELRHPESYYHVVRDVRGSATLAGEGNTITFRDGTHDNWIENCRQDGGEFSIRFTENDGEHGVQAGGYDNTIVNFISNGAKYHLDIIAGWDNGLAEPPTGNKVINSTFYGGSYLMDNAKDYLSTNEFINCIFDNIPTKKTNSGTFSPTWTDCSFSNGFTAPSGTGIITENPNFVNLTGFEPQNSNLIVGTKINNVDTDFNYNVRSNPTTIGAVKESSE